MTAVSLIELPVSVGQKNSYVYFTRSKHSFKGSKQRVICKEAAPSFAEEIDNCAPKGVYGEGPRNTVGNFPVDRKKCCQI